MVIKSRRHFVYRGAQTLLATAICSCSTLDRVLMGESSDYRDRVLIIGGGLSGLLCAYYLHREKIPFLLFEAEERLGGQILTVAQPFGPATFVDLGFDAFYEDDTHWLTLIRQLQLDIHAFSYQKISFWKDTQEPEGFLNGIKYPRLHSKDSDLWKRKTNWYHLSLEEWAKSLSTHPKWLEAVYFWSLGRTGYRWNLIPAAYFIKLYQKGKTYPWMQNQLVVTGGMETLIDRLSGEIFGAFPSQKLRLGYQLVAISRDGNNWSLLFQSPTGRKRYLARSLVLAINPQVVPLILGAKDWMNWGFFSSHLNQKWCYSVDYNLTSWQWGEFPSWVRKYVRKSLWGETKDVALIKFQTSVPKFIAKNGVVSSSVLSINWQHQNFIKGRSPGNLVAKYQPIWTAPEGVFFTHDLSNVLANEPFLSGWEALLKNAQIVTEKAKQFLRT
ncbi:MAG: FAD-dependent oxidoreductase [Bdellovibrionaceae bacterium]|nr:FAD-dependent oxidoreductase [Pseudobdellovibrionaceae bacterium]MDW8190858.1 FAD-dependent oxidoreductase [Pseudobdellovibrionaceae bacterium]